MTGEMVMKSSGDGGEQTSSDGGQRTRGSTRASRKLSRDDVEMTASAW